MILSDKHFSIKSSTDIQLICQPFFDLTGLYYFSYQRVDKSGFITILQNHPYLNKFALQTEFYKIPNSISSRLHPGQRLWSSLTVLSNLLAEIKSTFGTDNHFEIVTNYSEYFEVLHFAGRSGDNKVIEIYLSNPHLLTQFKFYFLEKAKPLIAEGSKLSNLIDLSKYVKNPPQITNESLPQALKYLQNNTKRYHIGPYKDQYLTKRELECLLYSLQGKNSVEIANILHISEKTVRSYLDLTKAKMEVSTKSELIQKAIDLDLLKLAKSNKV